MPPDDPVPAQLPPVRAVRFAAGPLVPNHPRWPLLLYRRAIAADADAAERALRSHGWGGTWRDGVFGYHHYHTTSHEALVVARGWARVRFGGPQGETVELRAGDVAILPAGTGHKRLAASADLLVVGGYPPGQEACDLRRHAPSDADRRRIAGVARPATDPVFGPDGPLLAHWPP